jgi:hypothetical protein
MMVMLESAVRFTVKTSEKRFCSGLPGYRQPVYPFFIYGIGGGCGDAYGDHFCGVILQKHFKSED